MSTALWSRLSDRALERSRETVALCRRTHPSPWFRGLVAQGLPSTALRPRALAIGYELAALCRIAFPQERNGHRFQVPVAARAR